VFNLIGKRYLFLIISLLVIIPGTISIIFKGFDVGIDFAGGSSLEFRPALAVANGDTSKITHMLDGLGFKDVQVTVGNDTNTVKGQVAWVRLNTQVDQNVQDAIQKLVQDKYGSGVSVTADPLQVTSNGKTTTITVITLASNSKTVTFKESDLTTLLSKLPNTTNVNAPSSSSSTTVSPVVTGTATATATAQATATATPKATATTTSSTPTATPTATSTPTATNPNANIPVKAEKIIVGQTTDTINILTTSTTSGSSSSANTPIRRIQSAFLDQDGNYLYTMSNSSVSASVASAAITNSILAVIAASVVILLYVWFAFRKVQKPWRYGACAIIALLHDVLVVLGIFSILGWTLKIQIDSLFITALLTVVGFSVHDTIVVFDRIRENMQRRSSESFDQIVNASLIQTMSRSLNTSLTVLFTLSALTLFGGGSTQIFTLALLIGIFSGTYSSIFNASMLLVIWEHGELGLWRLNRNAKRRPDGRNSNGRNRRDTRDRELAKLRG
jgi:preprotein translocase SecF subunit